MRRMHLLVCLAVTGCAGTLARSAGPVTSGAVQSLDDPANTRALGQVMRSPEVTEGARVLASEVGEGLAVGLAHEDVARDVQRLSSLAAAAAARTLVEVFRDEVLPEASRSLRTDLEGSLRPLIREVAHEATLGALAAVQEAAEQRPDDSLLGRMKALTIGAWLLMVAGLVLVSLLAVLGVRHLRRRARTASPAGLEPEVEAALRRLLRDPEWRMAMRRTLDEERPGVPH